DDPRRPLHRRGPHSPPLRPAATRHHDHGTRPGRGGLPSVLRPRPRPRRPLPRPPAPRPKGHPMSMYRKKPVTIEAHQVPEPDDLEAWGELAGWLLRHDCQALVAGPDDGMGVDGLDIPTLEGTMRASIGDWIIRGVAGE